MKTLFDVDTLSLLVLQCFLLIHKLSREGLVHRLLLQELMRELFDLLF